MSRFISNNASANIESVEFSGSKGGNLTLLTLKPSADIGHVRQLLATPELHQEIISETPTANGTLIVSRGAATSEQILQHLAAHEEPMLLPAPEKKFNPWAWRGYTSILGQSLQLASSIKGTGSASDRNAIYGFATLNLAANFINILFGGQEKNDGHQLRYLKQSINDTLAPHVEAKALLTPDDKALEASGHVSEKINHSAGSSAYNFLEKNSVTFGEIGLRTIGTLSLAFPWKQWGEGVKTFKESKSALQTIEAMKNKNPATFAVGLIMLAGKFVGFASKEPDPYNPTPPSAIETFRQKVTFPLSSIIESGATAWMTHDRFKNQKVMIGGKEHPDYYGGGGNLVFLGGYGFRLAAPYGTREVNMPELYAHTAKALAGAAPEQLPKLLAETSIKLNQHFKKSELDVSTIYGNLLAELEKYHHVSLPAAATLKPARIAEHLDTNARPLPSIVSDGRSAPERMQAPAEMAKAFA